MYGAISRACMASATPVVARNAATCIGPAQRILMSAQAVAKELSRLSYTDMLTFVKALNNKLGDKLDREVLANALAELGDELSKASADDVATDKHLRKVFGGRQKTIHVMILQAGYQVSHGKTQAFGQRLPDAINNLLDRVVVQQAMGVS
jgi:hypothetical protein